MQMHTQVPDRSAVATGAKRQDHVSQTVYAAVNGHAQAIVHVPPETGQLRR